MSFEFIIKFSLERKLAQFVLKKYKYITNLVEKELQSCPEAKHSDQVWTMWLQEDVPELCEVCINSIKKYYPNTIVITEKNLSEFVEIPSLIMDKYKSGKISLAHFSDLVRMCLLDKYGGTWIDATCYMTQPIPNYITKSPFFILKDFKDYSISNYFIHSDSNNYLTKCLKTFLLEYWKRENKACYYFMFHRYLLKILIKNNSKAKKLYDEIPFGFNMNTKIFYKLLYKDFEEDMFNFIKSTSYLHKLTYKEHDKNNTNPNSFYRHILKEDTKVSS